MTDEKRELELLELPVRFTREARHELRAIKRLLRRLCRGDIPLAELDARLKEIKARIKRVLETGLEPVPPDEIANHGHGGGRFGDGLDANQDIDSESTPARGGRLPVAKLRYTQISGDQQGSATFISTGREAFVQGGGAARPLPAEQTQRLRGAAAQVSQDGGVRKLDVPNGLRRQLGKLVGGDVRLVFEVADPNRKVSVPRPATG